MKSPNELDSDSLLKHGNRWALLVGVDHYDDAAISDLHVCAGDVQAIYNVLISNDYEPEEMKLLLSPGEDTLLATRAEILAALMSVAETAGENDLLLFYFSGHGIEHRGEAYILPADTRYTAIADTAINLNRIKQIIRESNARAKVLILDACHSGAQIGKAPPGMTEEFMRHVFEEAEGIAILSSCKQQQVSWEWREKKQSVFTCYLLEGLQGMADFDKKGFVTVSDISRYVTDKVKTWSVRQSLVQTPTLQYTVAGDIVLITSNKSIEKASEKQNMEKTQVTKTDLLQALYQAYKLEPGEWVNSEQIRRNLEIEQEQMNDFILVLRERGFVEAKFLGEKALLRITSDGVALIKQ